VIGKTPIELGYLRHKNDPSENYLREKASNEAFRPNDPRMNYLSTVVTELKPKPSMNTIHNNYNNIINTFGNPKRPLYAENELPNHSRIRENNPFPDNTNYFGGRKMLQPPGGGSSLKLWG